MQKSVFIICPVRNCTQETEQAIVKYVSKLEGEGYKVHWPKRDTDQNDANGTTICETNNKALYYAEEIHVWFDPNSQGTIFDLGMVFDMQQYYFHGQKPRRKIVIINREAVQSTPHKSFQNVLLAMVEASQ